jgi:tRNA pseudouridine32 synthase/23S rRNA pseudouridine746 synthase
VNETIWRDRVSRGQITLSDGQVMEEHSPYVHGITVFYRREVLSEPEPVEEPQIIYRDEDILVADKPHGMPVTPSGEHVERSLLIRLQRMTGLPDLDPVHRLDRETAGVVLFSIKPAVRARYHRLFAEGQVEREYFAMARVGGRLNAVRWRLENRIERGEPWYRQRIVDGPVNAITEIELIDAQSEMGRFRLLPKTGKKHQLRVHMASIGCPILGDPFYPVVSEKHDGDPPLQLLAKRLAFMDPLTGAACEFASFRTLLKT